VIVAGKRCPIAGRIMDLTAVDVTDLAGHRAAAILPP
jgi:alanine racemase